MMEALKGLQNTIRSAESIFIVGSLRTITHPIYNFCAIIVNGVKEFVEFAHTKD
jgi:phage-related protein